MCVYPSGKHVRKVSALIYIFCFYIENVTSVTKSVSTVNYGLHSGAKSGERYAFFITFCWAIVVNIVLRDRCSADLENR